MTELPKIGAFVLETLTTGMYTNPLDSIREFIQNSSDSIRGAERSSLIKKGEGRIQINISPKDHCLVIRDNGLGIKCDDAKDRLLNIGMSTKRIETDAGFRGIGRLAAAAYCQNLFFRTCYSGENRITTINIDCDGLRKAISPAMRETLELANVIANHSIVTVETTKIDQHFFEVGLDGVLSTALPFLDEKELEIYLCQVAPVTMDAHRFLYAKRITEWVKQHNLSYPYVTLVIKSPEIEREVFKPYRNRFTTFKESIDARVKDISFYPDNPSSDCPFWLWYAKTDLSGSIKDEHIVGLRLRKNNILIGGPERVSELFSQIAPSYSRFNSWYFGEIHIGSNEAIPNARRDDFETTPAWDSIKEMLTPFIRERCDEAYKASQARNLSVSRLENNANKIIDSATKKINTGFVSSTEKDEIIGIVKKEKDKAVRVRENKKSKNPDEAELITPIIDKLSNLESELEKNCNYVANNLRTDLDKKQRRVISEILEILFNTLDKDNFAIAQAAILKRYQVEAKTNNE